MCVIAIDLSLGVVTILVLYLIYRGMKGWRAHADRQHSDLIHQVQEVRRAQDTVVRQLLNPYEEIAAIKQKIKKLHPNEEA